MTFEEWTARNPQAAAELAQVFAAVPWNHADDGHNEQWSQQQARFTIARQGAFSWRNNVGATPAKIPTQCPRCAMPFEIKQQPVRYGLANDSARLNREIKSSDLILAIPRIITPDMVGQQIAQFGAVECKRPGWRYTGAGQEPAQLAWLTLVKNLGGFATFTTGAMQL